MLELVTQFLKDINIGQLIAIGVMFWFFYNRLDKKIENLDEKLSEKIEKLSEKMEKLSEKIEKLSERINEVDKRLSKLEQRVDDLDKRLCRIEGSLSTHGHCLLHQNQPMNKAQ